MTTYVIRDGVLVDKSLAAPRSGQATYVISDEMEPTRHMADGRRYTSKAKFRRATRDAGCVEVGNETAALLRPRPSTMPTREERRHAIRTQLQAMLRGQPR